MKKKELIDILYEHSEGIFAGDQILQGLKVMSKYFPAHEKLLRGAGRDEVYAMKAKKLCKAGLTIEDAEMLRDCCWDVNEYGVLVHSL